MVFESVKVPMPMPMPPMVSLRSGSGWGDSSATDDRFRDPAFRPSPGPNNITFRMVDLLFFAFNGSPALLNPNGN